MAASSARTLRGCLAAQLGSVLLGTALLGAGCEQSDDVVASLSALGDGGPAAEAAGTSAPEPTPDAGAPRCDTSQLYVLFSSIVRNQCRVSWTPATISELGRYFLENPPMTDSGETRPPSRCDLLAQLIGNRFAWAYEMNEGAGDYYLCPAHCDVAKQHVAAEDQRLLECQGFGDGS